MADLWHSGKLIVTFLLLTFIWYWKLRLKSLLQKHRRIFLGSEPCAPSVFVISNRDKGQVVNAERTRARLASLWFAILIHLLRLYFKFMPIPSWNTWRLKAQKSLSACKSSKCLNSIWIFNLSINFCFLSMIYVGESENFPTPLYRFCWL